MLFFFLYILTHKSQPKLIYSVLVWIDLKSIFCNCLFYILFNVMRQPLISFQVKRLFSDAWLNFHQLHSELDHLSEICSTEQKNPVMYMFFKNTLMLSLETIITQSKEQMSPTADEMKRSRNSGLIRVGIEACLTSPWQRKPRCHVSK